VLWTRLVSAGIPENQAVPIDWQIFEDASLQRLVMEGQSLAMPELGHSVHIEVSGLRADQPFYYRFRCGGHHSPIGKSRTLPTPTAVVNQLRLAFASCQRWDHGYYAAYRQMRADDPDLVLFLGDYMYESAIQAGSSPVRSHTLGAAVSLQDYRERYALYKSDPDLQAMHAACPWLLIWDDHELENNYAGQAALGGTEPLSSRRRAAYQAYYEHMPLRASTMIRGLSGLSRGDELRIYDAYDYGRLARIYMLDDRQYRSAPLCGISPSKKLSAMCASSEAYGTQRSLLGAEQEQWLEQQLEESVKSGIRWNIIGQQTRFTPANYTYGIGTKMNRDAWDGYPESRQRLIDALVRLGALNPVILGGDIHKNWVADIHHDPYAVSTPIIGAEYCGTSISSRSNSNPNADALGLRENPHCHLVNSASRGYGLVDINADRVLVTLRGVDDVTQPDSQITSLASFITRYGKPGVERLT
jgi:alkaline phosphatase D